LASGDIKQKIVLEGEKEYSAALKDAQRNLKVLRSELKAETAELGKNATQQQKNETRLKNLQKQIKEQEKVVKTYEKALKEVREKYGDNEEAIAKWQIKLNDARAALGKMKDGLTDTSKSMKDVGNSAAMSTVATNSLADSLGKVANAAGGISDAIENAFSGVVDRVRQTIGAVWTELLDIAARSDNYMDLAAYFGSTAEEVQKWDSAMRAAAGDMSTVTSLITRLKYSGKEKSVAEWFGISAENYTNDLEYFQAVMQQMVSYRDEMKRNGTWDTAMADIFGNKKGFDVEGILSDWGAILEGLNKFDASNGGYGLTEEQIHNMADLNTQVLMLKESWESLKRMGLVHLFGDLALNVTGNLQNIVDAFKEYFQADSDKEREAAVKKVKENIEAMFKSIAKAVTKGIAMLGEVADNLKKSDDPMVRAFGEFLDKIVGAMEWATNPDNWDTIKKGFEALIAVWAGGKILKALSNLASFVSHIKTIWQYNNGDGTPKAPSTDGSGSGGGNGGSPSTIPSGKPKGTGGSGTGGTSLWTKLFGGGTAAIGGESVGASIGTVLSELAIVAVVADGIIDNINISKQMAESTKKYNEQWARYSGEFGGSEYFDTWKSLYGYLGYAPGSMNEDWFGKFDEFVNMFHDWNYNDTENALIDKVIEAMSEEEADKLLEVMDNLFYGKNYSANEMEDEVYPALNRMLELMTYELENGGLYDIPADGWTDSSELSNNIGSLKTLPNNIEKSIERSMGKISVYMDKEKVGRMIAPAVSEEIARNYN